MKDEDFEWDQAKAASNLAKHKVSFKQARDVFRDPFAIELLDDREDYGEVRLILIGMTAERMLVVVYTIRDEKVRIISAREAEANERRFYHEDRA